MECLAARSALQLLQRLLRHAQHAAVVCSVRAALAEQLASARASAEVAAVGEAAGTVERACIGLFQTNNIASNLAIPECQLFKHDNNSTTWSRKTTSTLTS